MRTAGLDVGSRTVKIAVVEDGRVLFRARRPNANDPLAVCQDLLGAAGGGLRVAATGAGRALFARYFDAAVVLEVRALAIGARALVPGCRVALDVGGHAARAVALGPDGDLSRIAGHERCAAGTGRFLEATAAALGVGVSELAEMARAAEVEYRIESRCTVFAESEVVAHAARGVPRDALALGLHEAVAAVALGLLRTLPIDDPVAFVGGVALNPSIRELVEMGLGHSLVVPEEPWSAGAVGAALAIDGGLRE